MKAFLSLKLIAATAWFCGCGIIACQGGMDSGAMLKVFTREEGGATHFYIQNLKPAPVTATFQLQSSNMRASAGFPCTTTLAGNQTIEAFTLAPIRSDAPWDYTLKRSSVIGSADAVHDDSCVYLLPYAPGNSFYVSQGYHGRFSHTGPDEYAIDWRMPVGTPVHAAREGLVVEAKDDSDLGGPDRKFEKDANRILILHSDGTIAVYGHLKKGGNNVKVGDQVKAGDLIGLSGNTGYSNGPHLHFSVFKTRDGSQRLSVPVKFRTAEHGVGSLASGHWYTAAPLAGQGMQLVSALP